MSASWRELAGLPPETDESLAELYPEGRTFYYEGDDPATFASQCAAKGLTVNVTVDVPAERVGEWYRDREADGVPYGT